ncbi:MAG: hypothetical protein ACT4NL_17100 [Pseudomarimonas sp.]
MNVWTAGGLFGLFGLMLLGFRSLLVFDVADGVFSCQTAAVRMVERHYAMTYLERRDLQQNAEAECNVAQTKAKLAQAVLAPTTIRD